VEREVNIVTDYQHIFVTKVKCLIEERLKSYPDYTFSLRYDKSFAEAYYIEIEKKRSVEKWHSRLYRILVGEPSASNTSVSAYIKYKLDPYDTIEADCRSRDIEQLVLDIMRDISKMVLELEVEKRIISGNHRRIPVPSLTLNRKGYV
jgi:hypothetical protein